MEAGKNFIDLLLSLLLLPASTTFGCLLEIGLVEEGQNAFAGVVNLYGSLLKLEDHYLLGKKVELTSPEIPTSTGSQSFLGLKNSSRDETPKLFRCSFGAKYASNSGNTSMYTDDSGDQIYDDSGDQIDDDYGFGNGYRSAQTYPCTNKVSTNYNVRCKDCSSGKMTVAVTLVEDSCPPVKSNVARRDIKGFVKETVTFIVTDDLEMFLASTIKTVGLLNRVRVGKIEDLESLDVEVDAQKALEIMRSAYASKTVLNDVFGRTFKAKVSKFGY